MTKFDKNQFDMGQGSERWVTYGPDRRFVGRFKYMRPGANAKHFVKFLIANFTVEEYFGLLDGSLNGGKRMAPAEALRTKGYVSLNEKKAQEALAVRRAEETAFGTAINPLRLILVG